MSAGGALRRHDARLGIERDCFGKCLVHRPAREHFHAFLNSRSSCAATDWFNPVVVPSATNAVIVEHRAMARLRTYRCSNDSSCICFSFLSGSSEVAKSVRSEQECKKTDVAERPKAFHHVGLLVNEPPGPSRVALYYSHPKTSLKILIGAPEVPQGLH